MLSAPSGHECHDDFWILEAKEKRHRGRKPLPESLERNDTVLSPGETCEDCGGALKVLGEDVTEELEYVPGRFLMKRIVRPRLACTCCEVIHQSALPSRPIEKGRPGPGLLAHVLISKYADHLPLCRGRWAEGRLPEGDAGDYLRIEIVAPVRIFAELEDVPDGSDFDLFLYAIDGRLLASSQTGGSAAERLEADLTPDPYVLRVYPSAGPSPERYRLRWDFTP